MTNLPGLPGSSEIVLVTGPARSGKSEWAEYLAAQSQQQVCYVATAQTDETDSEWQQRIALHQQRRPQEWKTLTVPIELAATIAVAQSCECLLIDSLGTWLANLLEQDANTWQHTIQELLHSLVQTPAQVILVAEETGWGVVPAYASGRCFRDRLGQLTRQIGQMAAATYLVTGGHVLNLSQLGQPLPPELKRQSDQA